MFIFRFNYFFNISNIKTSFLFKSKMCLTKGDRNFVRDMKIYIEGRYCYWKLYWVPKDLHTITSRIYIVLLNSDFPSHIPVLVKWPNRPRRSEIFSILLTFSCVYIKYQLVWLFIIHISFFFAFPNAHILMYLRKYTIGTYFHKK